jgi:hypothetical protein
MKRTLLILALVLFATPSFAGQVTLAWDYDSTPVTGFRIYSRTDANYTTPLWQGVEKTCTVTVPDNIEVAFVARAYVVGGITGTEQESANSNEVIIPLATPEAPKNLYQRAIQAILNYFRKLG